MTNRGLIIRLILAIVLLGVAHVFLTYRGRVEDALVQRTAILDTRAEKAARIAVVRSDGAGAVLAHDVDWRLVEPYSAGVDQQTVLKLLGTLVDSPIENSFGDHELRRLGRTRGDFGLVDPRLNLTVSGEGFETSVSFGSASPDGRGVYAAVAGENAVYLVPSNVFAAVDLPPEGFRRRSLFWDDPDTVDSLDVKRGTGSFVRFVRAGEVWKMLKDGGEDVAASADKVKAILDGLSTATAVGFAWPNGKRGEPATATAALLAVYGLDPENAVTVTLKRKGIPDQQVSLGKDAGEGLVYALVQNAEAVVMVDRSVRDAALADLSAFTDDRLFPYDLSTVTRMSLTDGETAYLLAKGADGEWVLDSPVSAATDERTVDRLLERLAGLKTSDTNATGVAVSLTSNAAPVVVSRETALAGIRLEDLRSREILKIDPAGVKRVTVSGQQGAPVTAVVYDRDRSVWNVESSETSGKVDAAAVDAALETLNPLRAEWIVKMKVSSNDLRNYGLEAPRLTVAVDQTKGDAVRRNILIGNDAQGGSFATVGSSDAVFVLPYETVRRLSAAFVTEEAE